MYRPVRIIINILLNFAVLILFSTATVVVLCRVNNQTEMLNFLGFKSFVVSSGSMEPRYLKGSFVITKKVPIEEIKVGDVVAYQVTSDMFVFHRVVGVNDYGYTMKGDRSDAADGTIVKYDMVIGKEFFHTNFFVTFYNNLRESEGLAGLTVLTLVSIALVMLGIKSIIKLRDN